MCEINHFKKIVLCSGDVTIDLDHLHVKRIHLGCVWLSVNEGWNRVIPDVLSEMNLSHLIFDLRDKK
jgi:hypothetical protein